MSRVQIQDHKGSLRFDGSNDKVTIADSGSAFDFSDNFTVGAWINCFALPEEKFIGGKSRGTFYSYGLSIAATGLPRFSLYNGSKNPIGESISTPITLKRWHFLVGTYDGANIRIYLDGVLVETHAAVYDFSGADDNDIFIGRYPGTSADRWFKGLIKDFFIHNEVLSQSQVESIYRNGLSKLPDGTMGVWRLDDLDGSVAADETGNGNDGVISGAQHDARVPNRERFLHVGGKSSAHVYQSSASIGVEESIVDLTAQKTCCHAGWFKFNKKITSNYKFFDDGNDRFDLNIEGNTNKLFLWFTDDSNTGHLVGKTSYDIADKQWHFIVINKTDSRCELWVDCDLIGTYDNTDFANDHSPLFEVTQGNGIDYNVTDVRSWDTYLTPQEINDLMFQNKVPKRSNLQLEWLMDDNDFGVSDSSGNNNDATDVTDIVFNNEKPYTKRDILRNNLIGSYKFDGSNDDIELHDNVKDALTKNSAFTIEVLCKMDEDDLGQVLGSSLSGSDRVGITYNVGHLRFGVYNGSAWISGSGGFKAVPKKWYHCVLVYNGTSINALYVNGVRTSISGAYTPSTSSTEGSYLGVKSDGSSEPINGKIGIFKVWDTALTVDQVESIYKKRSTPARSNLVVELEGKTLVMNDSTWVDTSGNGNNATVGGPIMSPDTIVANRKTIGKNLIPNGDFSIAPYTEANTTSNDVVVDGTANGQDDGSFGSPPTPPKQLFKWKHNIYQTTGGYTKYETEEKYSGVASMKMHGAPVKERVNISLSQRNFSDSNNSYDIRTNLIPVKPSTQYKGTVRFKLQVENGVGTPGVYGFEVNFVEHKATGFKAHNLLNEENTANKKFSESKDQWFEKSITITTSSDTRFINPDVRIGGNSSNYADITVWVDEVSLVEV